MTDESRKQDAESIPNSSDESAENEAQKKSFDRFKRLFPETVDSWSEDLHSFVWNDALDFRDRRGVWLVCNTAEVQNQNVEKDSGFSKVDRSLECAVIDWLQWGEFAERLDKPSMPALALELIAKRKAEFKNLEDERDALKVKLEKCREQRNRFVRGILS